jgi:hypothetical protein
VLPLVAWLTGKPALWLGGLTDVALLAGEPVLGRTAGRFVAGGFGAATGVARAGGLVPGPFVAAGVGAAVGAVVGAAVGEEFGGGGLLPLPLLLSSLGVGVEEGLR